MQFQSSKTCPGRFAESVRADLLQRTQRTFDTSSLASNAPVASNFPGQDALSASVAATTHSPPEFFFSPYRKSTENALSLRTRNYSTWAKSILMMYTAGTSRLQWRTIKYTSRSFALVSAQKDRIFRFRATLSVKDFKLEALEALFSKPNAR